MSQPGAGIGSVKTSFAKGAILVANDAGKVFRLSWEVEKSSNRFLKAGNYTVRGYRIIKKDQNGKVWHISTMGPEIKSFIVSDGKETRLDINSEIVLNSGLMAKKGAVQVTMEITGENRSGLSIYANGKRIPIGYELLDSQGKLKVSGSMTYG